MTAASEPVFSPAVATFFTELADHNDRDWFLAHRDDYDALVRAPLDRLAALADKAYGNARVFRPNRDVRFTHDKSPYKLNGAMWAGSDAGVYLHVDADGVMAGGGVYQPDREQLRRARRAIDEHPSAGDDLAALADTLGRRDYDLAGPDLKTAPRGFPSDHRHIALLRLQHYAALVHLPLSATTNQVKRAWRNVEPLIAWVETYVGPPSEAARR